MTTHRLLWIVRAISILLALSAAASGQFTEVPGSPFTVGTQPESLAVGDFNGDAKPDLAIANFVSDDVTTPEVQTQWVRNEMRRFSSLSTLR